MKTTEYVLTKDLATFMIIHSKTGTWVYRRSLGRMWWMDTNSTLSKDDIIHTDESFEVIESIRELL